MDISEIISFLIGLVIIFGGVIFEYAKQKQENKNSTDTDESIPSVPPIVYQNPERQFKQRTVRRGIPNKQEVANVNTHEQVDRPLRKSIFQSSINLTTDYSQYSDEAERSIFTADDSIPMQLEDSEKPDEMFRRSHPQIQSIRGDGMEELKKAVIYSEILKPKF